MPLSSQFPLFYFLLLAAACGAAQRVPGPTGRKTANPRAEAEVGGGKEASAAMAEVLKRSLQAGWHELRIEAECSTDAGFVSVEIFGSGVGIWNHESQFNLTPDDLRAQLEAFWQADFASMRESYGGKLDPVELEKPPPHMTCRVVLGLDGATKQVVQLQGGRQSRELKELARRIFEICREPARSGVTADDLQNALIKVAEGKLAPEALHISMNRKTSPGTEREVNQGWLLRVDGRNASTRLYSPAEGYLNPVLLELGPKDLAELALLLGDENVGDLPSNLYGEHYTDLTVEVLNWRKHIQARQFAGMQPATHGQKQERFDRIVESLRQLQLRVLNEGR